MYAASLTPDEAPAAARRRLTRACTNAVETQGCMGVERVSAAGNARMEPKTVEPRPIICA